MSSAAIVRADNELSKWDQALYAFLAEKERRSGSMRTVQSCSRVLQHFFGVVEKTPDRVTSPEAFSWAHGIGLSGKRPSSITIGARLACLSSFYKFLIRMGLMQSNPCEAIERPKAVPGQPRGPTAEDIKRLLDVIPDTPNGLRDRAIIRTLTFTGRRRAEVMNLKAADIVREGSTVFYTYRGKGGKPVKRELPRPAHDAIVTALAAWGKAGDDEFRRVAVAFRWLAARNHQRHLLREPAALPGATLRRPGFRSRASTSFATRRRSCNAMSVSPSRK